MPKGEQRSNREAKKPKKAKAPATQPASSQRTPVKGYASYPAKPK